MTRRPVATRLVLSAALLSAGAAPFGTANAGIDRERLMAHVTYLADDAREGRGPGTAGLDAAAAYISEAFAALRRVEPRFECPEGQAFSDSAGNALRNVIGILRGDPGATHIIIGAHYDHLGAGGDTAKAVYNGADDNASGVAALLELARSFAEGDPPPRTIVFAAFSGEEEGLLGSRAYIDRPSLPLADARAMLNLDSIGRLREDRLVVFGCGTAGVFEPMLDGINRIFGFRLAKNREGVGAGDHQSFFERGVPVLHLFTDAHLDYHQPTDDADKVEFDGLARVTEFAAEIASYLSDESVVPEFIPAGAEKIHAPAQGGRRRVSLGTIPDFAQESGGYLVSGIVPGSPAESAGLRPGDVIVAIDGSPIDNLYDYTAVLKSHEPGDRLRVEIVRDGKRQAFDVTLASRR
jgi:hypothetical protein